MKAETKRLADAPVPPQLSVKPGVGEPRLGALDPEYDRRGVLLPARTRVGGIITPQ